MAALNQQQAMAQGQRLMNESIPFMIRPRTWSKAFYALMVPEAHHAGKKNPDLSLRLGTEAEVDSYLSQVQEARKPIPITGRIFTGYTPSEEEEHIFIFGIGAGPKYISREDNGLPNRQRGWAGAGRFSLGELRRLNGLLTGPDGKKYRVVLPNNLIEYER